MFLLSSNAEFYAVLGGTYLTENDRIKIRGKKKISSILKHLLIALFSGQTKILDMTKQKKKYLLKLCLIYFVYFLFVIK